MYETGQEVPENGFYRVEHPEHRLAEEVILAAGQRFPRCSRCSSAVRFEWARSAPRLCSRSSIVVHQMAEIDDAMAA
jgi:hypothetical protein